MTNSKQQKQVLICQPTLPLFSVTVMYSSKDYLHGKTCPVVGMNEMYADVSKRSDEFGFVLLVLFTYKQRTFFFKNLVSFVHFCQTKKGLMDRPYHNISCILIYYDNTAKSDVFREILEVR